MQIPNYVHVKLVTEATTCVRFVNLSRKPEITFFITVPTLDNSGQILHHPGTYYQNIKSTYYILFGIFSEKCPLQCT